MNAIWTVLHLFIDMHYEKNKVKNYCILNTFTQGEEQVYYVFMPLYLLGARFK